ncbi:MAG TPA: hypothetical protein VG474_04970 [Solirubrobacteraceae bacterium]|nr:hypothetical protein [Solirubrobacteraceae bacterium]
MRRRFRRLAAPELGAIAGRHHGSFPGPEAYDLACRSAMAATGLPCWHGKRFDPPAAGAGEAHGVNLVRDGEATPLTARIAPSLIDGRPTLVCRYRPQETPPYRWVRDELRAWDESTLLGLAFLDLPVLRGVGFPFVLRRQGGGS